MTLGKSHARIVGPDQDPCNPYEFVNEYDDEE
jgi:hypothetical protein